MGYVDFLLAGIPVFIYTLVPGFLLAMPLLKNSRLSLYEKVVIGFILGLVLPAFLLFLLGIVGIGYSFFLAIACSIIIAAAGLAWGLKEGAFAELPKFEINLDSHKDQKKLLIWGGLTLLMIWAFWARVQSLTPIFYEFDPYYYMYGSMYLLRDGVIPLNDVTAWYPQGGTHRLGGSMTNYLAVQWYSIFTQGGAYDNYTLSAVSNIYPPLVGALLCFLLFILVKEEYGAVYGIAAAIFAAVLPRFIQKFAAGEAEIQPWGLFALFFFAAAYALLLHRKDRRLAVLAGIAAMSVINGSQYFIILSLAYGGYLGIQSLLDFLKGKDLREFLELNGIVVACIVMAALTMWLYLGAGYPMFERIFVVVAPYAFAAALYYISKNVSGSENKSYALLGIAALGLVILLLTPVGDKVIGYVNSAAGFAGHPEALYLTVAEEAPTYGEFSSAFDVLGYTIVPGFTLIHLTLLLAGAGILYGIYRDSRLAIFFALLIYPISYVGMSKSKYVLQLGFMLVLALAIVFGETEKCLRAYFKDEAKRKQAAEYVKYAMAAFTLIVLLEPSLGEMKFKGTAVELAITNMDGKYWLANGQADCNAMATDGQGLAYYLHCDTIPDYWMQPMDWIKANVENDTRVVSWWDYGHWINYFGQKDCLTRNEHVNTTLDLMVADKFVFGAKDSAGSGEADLAQFMRDYKTKYVLFDYDLIGKWGALDFLACVYNNQTNQTFAEAQGGPGSSKCEAEHYPERVFLPLEREVGDYCRSPEAGVQLVRALSSFGVSYCVYETNTSDGYTVPRAMFYEDNMSRQNKAILAYPQRMTVRGRDYAMYTALYFPDASIWQDNVSGWDDRKGKYYDSTFYKAFYIGELQGFDKVYEYADQSGQPYVRIFKLKSYP